jgi:hypothetical protein
MKGSVTVVPTFPGLELLAFFPPLPSSIQLFPSFRLFVLCHTGLPQWRTETERMRQESRENRLKGILAGLDRGVNSSLRSSRKRAMLSPVGRTTQRVLMDCSKKS